MAIWASKLNVPKNKKAVEARVRLLETFLQAEMENMIVGSMVAATRLSEKWGLVVDWHEFSEVLSGMEMKGLARHKGFSFGRVAKYYIIPADQLAERPFDGA